jgi:hypothetical protein
VITNTRCKFYIESVKDYGNNQKQYVLKTSYCPELAKEDHVFSKMTPSGEMTVTINNPLVHELLKVGQKVYVDITPVEGS